MKRGGGPTAKDEIKSDAIWRARVHVNNIFNQSCNIYFLGTPHWPSSIYNGVCIFVLIGAESQSCVEPTISALGWK